MGFPLFKSLADTKRQTAQLDLSAHVNSLYALPHITFPLWNFQKALSSVLCHLPGLYWKCGFLKKWLCWEITLPWLSCFAFRFSGFIPSHSALLSRPVSLSCLTHQLCQSEVKQDAISLMWFLCISRLLSVFNLHNSLILLNSTGSHFSYFLGHVVIKRESFGASPLYPWRKTKQRWLSHEARFRHGASCWLRLLLRNQRLLFSRKTQSMTYTNKEIFTRANGVGNCQAEEQCFALNVCFCVWGCDKSWHPLGFRPLCLDVLLQCCLL